MQENELQRRDKILSVITQATEIFLRGSLAGWQQNVFSVIRLLGTQLGIRRIFLCKNEYDIDRKVTTDVRYEWIAEGDVTNTDVSSLQEMDLEGVGFKRWVETFEKQEVIVSKVSDLPLSERGWFMSEDAKSIIAVPVFVEQSWWGFLGLENYAPEEVVSPAEIDAFKAVSVIFGAAIHRKRTEEALERERKSVEQKVREIEDVARFPAEDPSPVLRVSKDGVVLYVNRSARPLLTSWQASLGTRIPKEWQTFVRSVYEQNQEKSADVLCGIQTFSVLFSPMKDGDYVNLYGRDVTKEREVDQMKSDFISMASHQLRTPLTTIRWYSDKLLNRVEHYTDKEKEWAHVVYDTTVQLVEMVDGLLNISRIERGKIEPHPLSNDLQKLISACVSEMQVQADQKQITIATSFPREGAVCWFDIDLIREVQRNLLSNAIKYSKSGSTINVIVTSVDNQITIAVKDTGIGIPEADKDKIFQRFYRASNATSSGIEGTGLGLAFAKMILDKSNGKLWFESKQDAGTTFYYSLPLRELPKSVEKQEDNNVSHSLSS